MQDREAAQDRCRSAHRRALFIPVCPDPGAGRPAPAMGRSGDDRSGMVAPGEYSPTGSGHYPDKVDHPEAPWASYFNRKALDRKGAPHGDVVDSMVAIIRGCGPAGPPSESCR